MLQKVRRHPVLGALVPACLAAVAYVDPGNFGVNVEAGARFEYRLVWVVIAACVVASVVQYLAAKLGLATGQSLAEHCRQRCSRPVQVLLWVMAEVVVVMTDLAELVGGALALHMLFGVQMFAGAVIVGSFTFVVLACRLHGRGGFAAITLSLLGVVAVAVVWQVVVTGIDLRNLATELAPAPLDAPETLLVVGIIGATVMPHALHFHSALSRPGTAYTRRPVSPRAASAAARELRRSIGAAMAVAGVVNVAIVLASARLPSSAAGSLTSAYSAIGDLVGRMAAVLFAVALLAAGLASTLVGAYTGQVVMEGFSRRNLSLWLVRGLSLVPPLVLLGLGLDATRALVLSQVALSFALPMSLVPLVIFTGREEVMGRLVNRRSTTVFAAVATALIIALDGYLLLASAR